MNRQHISSGSVFEERVGYSRAVRVGAQVWVAGTAPIMPGSADPPDDPYEQARICFEIIAAALFEAGSSLADVVRSRIYLASAADIEAVGRAHREALGGARPACTAVVTALLDPRWRVEIEVDAVTGGAQLSEQATGASLGARSVLDHRFGSTEPYTLGVEEEYMLLDPESWDLVQRADAVLEAAAAGPLEPFVKSELLQSVVEVATPVCASASEIAGELRRLRAAVAGLAADAGCRFASAGTHPFALFERQQVTDEQRYRAMVDVYQALARQQLIFGLHVHAAVDEPDKAVQVVDALLPHVAEVLALSANSPFWRGELTGLASCRHMVFSALPRTGIPPRLRSYIAYSELVGELERSGCISDYTRIWWDVRPHPRFGTVELRICDAVTRLDDAVAIAAFFQALVKLLCEEVEAGRPPASFRRILTTENKWLAARYGLDAPLIDLAGGRSERVPASELVRRTLGAIEPHARELGSERELEGIAAILAEGNGATAQLRSWRRSADLGAVVHELADASEAPA